MVEQHSLRQVPSVVRLGAPVIRTTFQFVGDIPLRAEKLGFRSCSTDSAHLASGEVSGPFHRFGQKGVLHTNEEETFPDSYEGLNEWIGRALTGRLVLHPRAFRGLKDARYENVQLVYESLLPLAREYRDMRLDNRMT